MKLTNGACVLLSYAVEVFYRHEKKHEWRKQLAVLMLHLHLSKHELLAPVRMHALATVAAACGTACMHWPPSPLPRPGGTPLPQTHRPSRFPAVPCLLL